MQDDIRIDALADARLLGGIRSLVRSYAICAGLSEERAGEVVLAVDEACTNAIRHAYRGEPGGRLLLSLTQADGHMDVVLRDQGEPIAECNCVQPQAFTPDPATLKPGGLGLQLIYSVFDDVQIHPGTDRGNYVRMRLRLPQESLR